MFVYQNDIKTQVHQPEEEIKETFVENYTTGSRPWWRILLSLVILALAVYGLVCLFKRYRHRMMGTQTETFGFKFY